jgi:hypothetical protein
MNTIGVEFILPEDVREQDEKILTPRKRYLYEAM